MSQQSPTKHYPVHSKIKPETAVILEILGVSREDFIKQRNNYIHDAGINSDLSLKKLHYKFKVIGISLESITNLFK